MRRASKIDGNQNEIVDALRQIPKCNVLILSMVGGGCPDVAVGYRGRNVFFEIKDPSKPPSKQRLTPDQVKWHSDWPGEVYVIRTIDEALEVLGCTAKQEPKRNSAA